MGDIWRCRKSRSALKTDAERRQNLGVIGFIVTLSARSETTIAIAPLA